MNGSGKHLSVPRCRQNHRLAGGRCHGVMSSDPRISLGRTRCSHYELTLATQKQYFPKVSIRAVLQLEESNLGATCPGRWPTHADGTRTPWVPLTLYISSLSGKLKREAGVIGEQSSLHKGLRIITIKQWSHGMDEVIYKEGRERRESRVHSLGHFTWQCVGKLIWPTTLKNICGTSVFLCCQALGSSHFPPPLLPVALLIW